MSIDPKFVELTPDKVTAYLFWGRGSSRLSFSNAVLRVTYSIYRKYSVFVLLPILKPGGRKKKKEKTK